MHQKIIMMLDKQKKNNQVNNIKVLKKSHDE